jgi:hypothetical protein
MKISLGYNRVESAKFVLDRHDLRRAAVALAKESPYWPKKITDVEVEFCDDEDGHPYCEVIAKLTTEEKPPASDARLTRHEEDTAIGSATDRSSSLVPPQGTR